MDSKPMNRKVQTPLKKTVFSFLFIALSIFTLLNVMSTKVYAILSGDFEYELISPTSVEITGYTGSETDVVIPSTLDGYDVTQIGNGAFQYNSSLTSIDIPDSVTSIGTASFLGCSSLTSIDLPESLTSIGVRAFNRSGLTSIKLPTSVVSIGDDAFRGCSNLASIEFPDGLVSIGHYAFSGCSSLISIDIPNNITSIGLRAFEYCSSLSSVNLPDKLTGIGAGLFMGCTSLTNINVPDSVTYIGKAGFAGCSSLTDIDLPDSFTSIGDLAFSGCTSLTNIDIPESVTHVYDLAFLNCSNLISARFFGNATTLSMSPIAFDGTHADFKVYYLFGTSGYTNPWYSYPTEPFFIVTYFENGSTSGSVPIDSMTYLSEENMIVLGNTGNLEKTGYLFDEWNTESDGSGTDYATDATIPMGFGNVDLFAQWKDVEAPVITLNGDALVEVLIGSVYTDAGVSAFDNVDGDISALVSVTGSVDTSIPGTYTIKYNVSDSSGNAAIEVTRSIAVLYEFEGFFDPVSNPPAINSVQAGSEIQMKFSLNGNRGLAIFMDGYPLSRVVSDFSSTVSPDDIKGASKPSKSDLVYNPRTGIYTYKWKTEKSWVGRNREFIMMLKDGKVYTAYFNFKK